MGHYHELLAVDGRFAYPSLYEVVYPHTFLSTERLSSRLMRLLMAKHRPQDNMRMDPAAAWEDEFAMCVLGFRTPYLAWAFPERRRHYDRYLTFRNASAQEVDQWKASFQFFLKKLTFKHGKLLLLKSPPHTARIRLLLGLFPRAKFVHICRNPYTVFQSFVHTHATVSPTCRLQRTDSIDWNERVIELYRDLYGAFFDERHLIPAGQYHEVRFEELENDPLAEMRKLYGALNLPGFDQVESELRRYVDSIQGYEKNVFRELPTELCKRIGREWRRCFEAWNYPLLPDVAG